MREMKKDLMLSSGLLILLIAMIGATIFLPTGAAVVEATVKFDPDKIDLGAPGWTFKEGIVANLWFPPGPIKLTDVDPKTILLAGFLGPKGGWKHGVWIERDPVLKKRVLKILFSGSSLVDYISVQIYHDGNGGNIIDLPLTITGLFYDGEPFEGTGYITVHVPDSPAGGTPPPPP